MNRAYVISSVLALAAQGFLIPVPEVFRGSSLHQTEVVCKYDESTSTVSLVLPIASATVASSYSRATKELGRGITMKGFKINSPLPASVVLPKIMSNPKLKRAHLKQTLQMAVRVSIDACVNRPPLSQYELVGEPRLVGDLDVIDSFLDPEGSSEIALEVECDVWPR